MRTAHRTTHPSALVRYAGADSDAREHRRIPTRKSAVSDDPIIPGEAGFVIDADATMIRPLLTCAILLVAATANADEIHKCVGENGITYQGLPCGGREAPPTSAMMDAVQGQAPRPADDGTTPECGVRPRTPARLPWRQATICIGMTDDEVLNLPGWGRPAKIIRTREPRRWHEEWTYGAGATRQRLLHFVNGKLAGLETEAPVTPDDSLSRVVSN